MPRTAERGSRALAGQVAIVTGASSGIGAATATELAGRGAAVVLAARRTRELLAGERAIIRAGGQAMAVPADLTDARQVELLAARAAGEFGRVDVLVNNAGADWRRPLASSPPDGITGLLAVNLLGPMLLTRLVLPGMLERGRGAVVCIGSLSGRVAMEPVYSATKYGLRGFCLALRRQVAGSGVSVSLVSPGRIATAMAGQAHGRLPAPELVAAAVADLVLRPRRELVIPRKHYLIAWTEQLLPGTADRIYQWRRWSPVTEGEPAAWTS